jgi:hypothetical protein
MESFPRLSGTGGAQTLWRIPSILLSPHWELERWNMLKQSSLPSQPETHMQAGVPQ